MTTFYISGFIYWLIGMCVFIRIKAVNGDEVPILIALGVSFFWPLTLVFYLSILFFEHFIEGN